MIYIVTINEKDGTKTRLNIGCGTVAAQMGRVLARGGKLTTVEPSAEPAERDAPELARAQQYLMLLEPAGGSA